MADPIIVYFWPTPNGQKVTIALEEMGLPYEIEFVDIGAGDQFAPDFLKIAPNNRMPAIVDPDGPGGTPVSVFESGAILQYLAKKTGQFGGGDPREEIAVTEWLMWQMGGVGPMAGQSHHFIKYAPGMEPPQVLPYAQERYRREVGRLYGVLDKRLDGRDYAAGPYSIADMALWPWVKGWEGQEQTLDDKPNLAAWIKRIAARPAVKRAMEIGRDKASAVRGKAAQDLLFGKFEKAK
ncbi:MAG: glutathione S-transferase N-terminal domain-containing protein [Pseudomonadota bacterium]